MSYRLDMTQRTDHPVQIPPITPLTRAHLHAWIDGINRCLQDRSMWTLMDLHEYAIAILRGIPECLETSEIHRAAGATARLVCSQLIVGQTAFPLDQVDRSVTWRPELPELCKTLICELHRFLEDGDPDA